jgi:hypothetical protein
MRTNSTSSVPLWTLLTLSVLVAAFALPRSLSASLGGDATSVESDRAKLQASLQTTNKDRFTVHEMKSPNNVTVREFVSPAGKVFGVAWQGPTRPDLHQLLGAYFDQFVQAAQTQKSKTKSRGPLSINAPGLVVHSSGHQGYFVGQAYVPQMLPANVHAEEIQ